MRAAFNGHNGDEDTLMAVLAAADLVDRAGANNFNLGYDEGSPITWHAQATYRGKRLHVEGQPTPEAAAIALAVRLLTGAACRCGKKIALREGVAGCLWVRDGKRWNPGCDDPPIAMPAGSRGDLEALQKAVNQRTPEGKRRAS